MFKVVQIVLRLHWYCYPHDRLGHLEGNKCKNIRSCIFNWLNKRSRLCSVEADCHSPCPVFNSSATCLKRWFTPGFQRRKQVSAGFIQGIQCVCTRCMYTQRNEPAQIWLFLEVTSSQIPLSFSPPGHPTFTSLHTERLRVSWKENKSVQLFRAVKSPLLLSLVSLLCVVSLRRSLCPHVAGECWWEWLGAALSALQTSTGVKRGLAKGDIPCCVQGLLGVITTERESEVLYQIFTTRLLLHDIIAIFI